MLFTNRGEARILKITIMRISGSDGGTLQTHTRNRQYSWHMQVCTALSDHLILNLARLAFEFKKKMFQSVCMGALFATHETATAESKRDEPNHRHNRDTDRNKFHLVPCSAAAATHIVIGIDKNGAGITQAGRFCH
jgi:hypothetical protein